MFEPGDFRGIRDFVETTKFPQFFKIMKKNKEQGICGDGKNMLDNQSPQEGIQVMLGDTPVF